MKFSAWKTVTKTAAAAPHKRNWSGDPLHHLPHLHILWPFRNRHWQLLVHAVSGALTFISARREGREFGGSTEVSQATLAPDAWSLDHLFPCPASPTLS